MGIGIRGIHRIKATGRRILRRPVAQQFTPAVVQKEILSGITVALALIPESLAFAAIAKVNPMVALYTSFCMAIVIAIAGGRPAMISAATGSMALLMTSLVANHGVEYLFAATVLTGVLQFSIGLFKLEKVFSFIPQSVIAGFVNGLGILIFVAQIQQFAGEPWQMPVMVAVTLAIVYLFPRITKAVPAPLVAIIAMTIVAIGLKLPIRRVGDIGEITRNLPSLHFPNVPFTLETLGIILPYAVTLAIVGLLESLLTAALLDDLTDTSSSRNQETKGQGIANIVTGFLGGMAGCGMVGQSIINVRSGGSRRLSTGVAGAFLLFSIFALRDWVQQIPMAALVGVMIMVAFETFDWRSLTTWRKTPMPELIVMPLTVGITLLTHDLAKGVIVGVLVSLLIFGWQAANVRVTASLGQGDTKVYALSGQLFFGSTSQLIEQFTYRDDPPQIILDLHHAHLWDFAAASSLAKIISKYHQFHKQVRLVGLTPEGAAALRRAGIPPEQMILRTDRLHSQVA